MKNDLTAEYVRSILDYNPNTGQFTRLNVPGTRTDLVNKPTGSAHNMGYITIFIKGKHYYAHRLAWLIVTGAWPSYDIDHKNNIRNDNKWENLRLATKSQNLMNTGVYKSNTVGYKGVHKRKNWNKWRARIIVNGKRLHLGDFNTPEEAALAYNEAAIKYHKEFANLN
jgi:hypothetical protein